MNLSYSDLSASPIMTGPPKNRQRRNRTYFSDEALNRLERIFHDNPYPDIVQRENLGEEIGVSEARIQVWFQNRRSRNRRNKTKKTKKSPPSTSSLSSLSSTSLSTSSSSSSSSSSPPSPRKTTPIKPKPLSSLPSLSAAQPTMPSMMNPYPYSPYMYNPYLMASIYPMMSVPSPLPNSPLWSPGTPQNVNRYFDFTMPYSPTGVPSPYPSRFSLPLTPDPSPSPTNQRPTYMAPYSLNLDPVTSSSSTINGMTSLSPAASSTRDMTSPRKEKGHQEEDEIDVVTP